MSFEAMARGSSLRHNGGPAVDSGKGGVVSRVPILILVFVSGVFLGTLATPGLAVQFRTGKNTQLTKSALAGCSGKEISISINEFGSGTSGPHYHQGESFTYILQGSETYQVEGKPEIVVRAGDLLHEEPMKVHTVANNDPVKLLVIRVQDKDVPDIVRVTPKPRTA